MAAQGEEAWYVARTKLLQLLQTQPQYTNEQYATACQMSLSWVKRWKKLLKAHPNPSEKEVATLLQGKPSTPKTKPKPLDPFLVERILYHRQQQANLLNRPPGPRTLVFYLNQDREVKERGLSVPGTTTIWQVLVRYGCIPRPHYEKNQPRTLNEPMQHWQADFKDSARKVPIVRQCLKQLLVSQFQERRSNPLP
jgi:hypothetical protein